MLEKHSLFIADTYVNEDPTAEQLVGIARMAADEVRRFGMPPKVAFLSHSNYGSSKRASARKRCAGPDLFKAAYPTSSVMANCVATLPCRWKSAVPRCCTPHSKARPTFWSARTWTLPTFCSMCSRSPPVTA
jgi:hypothetical protein